jgi:hypothetical protein
VNALERRSFGVARIVALHGDDGAFWALGGWSFSGK